MMCPVCGGRLRAVERLGISLEHCVTCAGIWLDQGELTELVRREALQALEKGMVTLQERRTNREYDAVDQDAPSLY